MNNENNNHDGQDQPAKNANDTGNQTETGTHKEGQYDKRDDDATMHPSSIEEKARAAGE